jgi:hypothetical protein
MDVPGARKKQIGHLFQGRHKAILVDADNYFLELVRYIHNNPVRAQLIYSQNTPLKQYPHYDILGVF